jgi:hypothetical protein
MQKFAQPAHSSRHAIRIGACRHAKFMDMQYGAVRRPQYDETASPLMMCAAGRTARGGAGPLPQTINCTGDHVTWLPQI